MKLSTTLQSLSLIGLSSAAPSHPNSAGPQDVLLSGDSSSSHHDVVVSDHRIPTAYESAVMGRRILALSPLGVLATVFPAEDDAKSPPKTQENRPPGMGGMPHALMDYVADCEGSGNPTFLAINIETTFKNVRAGSNVSLSQAWTPPHPPKNRIESHSSSSSSLWRWVSGKIWGGGAADKEDEDEEYDPVPYSAANLPRYSLLGYIEEIEGADKKSDVASCFVDTHRDAKYWLPGNRIHEAEFVRLVVTQVYWVGGFGDRAYIGWIDPADWKAVTDEEWQGIRLPGEKKGWDEWSVEL